MVAVMDADERVTEVHLEGLALLKIVKHCHESLPQMVTGSLLGLSVGNGVFEISHAFSFPESSGKSSDKNNADEQSDEAGGGAALEGHEFQLEMMRMLREVNVDNNCVGWYQSMYLGIYSTASLLENQGSYQADLSPNAVVLLLDPLQTTHGKLVLKCLRLTDECVQLRASGKNTYLDPNKIFEEVPVKLTNPGLVRALLADIQERAMHEKGADPVSTTFDRLDLSTNPYLEKHLEFLSGWVDDLAAEQHKFQYYTRQLSRTIGAQDRKEHPHAGRHHKLSASAKAKVQEEWQSSNDAPRRMESLLIANQIQSYCQQMDQWTSSGLQKLFLVNGLHNDDDNDNEANAEGDDKKGGLAAEKA